MVPTNEHRVRRREQEIHPLLLRALYKIRANGRQRLKGYYATTKGVVIHGCCARSNSSYNTAAKDTSHCIERRVFLQRYSVFVTQQTPHDEQMLVRAIRPTGRT